MMPRMSHIAAIALVLSSTAALADQHGNDLVHARELNGSVFMMNQYHMSLYTFDGDGDGVSNCYGTCAETWPPALLPADAELGENYSLIERDDGTMQIAYKGHPLYLYSGDNSIGDVNGEGIDGTWRISRPLP